MLSLGSAAFFADKTLIGTFSANIETLPEASSDSRTMHWWHHFSEAWKSSRSDPRLPVGVMRDYVAWLRSLPGTPLFVGRPACLDFMWVYWYLVRFTNERPFGESTIDTRSYAMGMRKASFSKAARPTC